MLSALFLQITLLYGLLASAQTPPQLGYTPLAVKSPYLHGWIASNDDGSSPARIWPNFFTTSRVSYLSSFNTCELNHVNIVGIWMGWNDSRRQSSLSMDGQ